MEIKLIAPESSSIAKSMRVAVVHGLVWSAFEKWGGQILGFVVFVILARLLDSYTFGLVALAGVYLSFIQIFVSQGFGTALVQRKNITQSHLDTVFWINISSAIFLAITTIIFREQIAVMMGDRNISQVLSSLAVGLPLAGFSVVPSAILIREMNFKFLAIRTSISIVVGGVVGIITAIAGFGVWSLVLQQLTGNLIAAVVLWKSVSWKPCFRMSWRALSELSIISIGVMGNNILWIVSQRIDQGLIGARLGVELLGVYWFARRIIDLSHDAIVAPTQTVALPAFSKLQSDHSQLRDAFMRSTSFCSAIIIPFFLSLIFLSSWLIPSIFGSKWKQAVLPMQVLCIAGMFRGIQAFVHPTFLALGKIGSYTIIFMIYTTISLAGSWLMMSYGIVPVAWAIVIAAGFIGIINFIVLGRFLGFTLISFGQVLWPIMGPSAILTSVILVIQECLSGRLPEIFIGILAAFGGLGSYCVALTILSKQIWVELKKGVVLLLNFNKHGEKQI